MTQEHPVHPSRNLIQQWLSDYLGCTVSGELSDSELYLATQAARWGADQELEACCHLLRQQGFDVVDDLRATRRPKPPSLKEQALQALAELAAECYGNTDKPDTIRRALEKLDD